MKKQNKDAERNHFDEKALKETYSTNNPKDIYPMYNKILGYIYHLEPYKSHVLDVGCGIGNNSIIWGIQGFNTLGVDISQNAIIYAKLNNKLSNIEYICEDIENIDQFDNFDIIFCGATLHHLPNTQKIVKLFNKKLNERGYIIFYEPNINHPYIWFGHNIVSKYFIPSLYTENERALSQKELLKIFENNNFDILLNETIILRSTKKDNFKLIREFSYRFFDLFFNIKPFIFMIVKKKH